MNRRKISDCLGLKGVLEADEDVLEFTVMIAQLYK